MHDIEILLMLLMAVVALVASAKRLDIPYPIVLVVGGLILSFIPDLPVLKFTPDLIFLLFLPPLLHSEAWFTSWRDLQRNWRPIGLLAIGLVLTTTLSVAFVVHWFIPGFPLAPAFALGAIAAPTDAVAVSAVGERLRLPRRILVVLSGESLINDATALVVYRAAVLAVVSGTFSLGAAAGSFVLVSLGGIAIGLILGVGLASVLQRTRDTTLASTISLFSPYLAYLSAERLHVSGVLATVSIGLYLGRQASHIFSPQQRMQALGFWQVLVFLLNGLLFILVGLQMHSILATLAVRHWPTLLAYATLVSLTVIVTRIVWVALTIYGPALLISRRKHRETGPPWQNAAVVGWSGARGGVSLASALAIPLLTGNGTPFPQRDMILFLTFSIIFATLVLQGLTLPPLIRRLNVTDDGKTEKEERLARLSATQGAMKHLDAVAEHSGVPNEAVADIRGHYEERLKHLNAPADQEERARLAERKLKYRQLKRALLTSERDAIVKMRDEGVISDDALHRIQRDLDLEEVRLEPPDKD
ncbi:MAG: Na+/H+ antiporter [Chthonomonadaceae bacterium]|nr:Na+/H+ antiporter [Chthonomonadaceae bacterium]